MDIKNFYSLIITVPQKTRASYPFLEYCHYIHHFLDRQDHQLSGFLD